VATGLTARNDDTQQSVATRILIADDTVRSRELLRSILESSGYEVLEAEDGEQVVAQASAFGPNLIILDLQMPKMNGYDAAKALRKTPAFKTTPILALTAAISDMSPDAIAAAGFTGYLVKPIGPARLRQCIAEYL